MSRRSARRRLWGPVALVAAALFLVPPTTSAQVVPTVAFDPAFVSVLHRECSPDTFSVAVVIDETPTPVQGFEIVFHFDPAVIMPVDVLPGALLPAGSTFFYWTNQSAVGDSVHIDAAVLGGTFEGPGELAQIRFEKLMPHFSALDWTLLTFRDHLNHPIVVDGEGGYVEIEACSVPVDPASWGRVKREVRKGETKGR